MIYVSDWGALAPSTPAPAPSAPNVVHAATSWTRYGEGRSTVNPHKPSRRARRLRAPTSSIAAVIFLNFLQVWRQGKMPGHGSAAHPTSMQQHAQ